MTFYSPDFAPHPSTDSVHIFQALPKAAFTFRTYPKRKQVCLTISGFWNIETLEAFALDLHAAIGELNCRPGEHTLCCDVSDAAIQAQDIVNGFQRLISEGPTHARKLALWTSRPLSRMQSRRLMSVRDNFAVFDNEAEALRWLAA